MLLDLNASREIDVCALSILSCKRVVVVPTGRVFCQVGDSFLTVSVVHCLCSLTFAISSQIIVFLLVRFTVSSHTKWFSPEDGWFSRNSGCQDVAVPPQIRVWGSFCFCCYSPPFSSLAIIFGRVFSIVVPEQFCRCSFFVVVLVNLTAASYPATLTSSLISDFLSEFFIALSTGGCVVLRRAGVPLPASASSHLSSVSLRCCPESDQHKCLLARTHTTLVSPGRGRESDHHEC